MRRSFSTTTPWVAWQGPEAPPRRRGGIAPVPQPEVPAGVGRRDLGSEHRALHRSIGPIALGLEGATETLDLQGADVAGGLLFEFGDPGAGGEQIALHAGEALEAGMSGGLGGSESCRLSFHSHDFGEAGVAGLGRVLELLLERGDLAITHLDVDVEAFHRGDLLVEPAQLGVPGGSQGSEALFEVGDHGTAGGQCRGVPVSGPGRPLHLRDPQPGRRQPPIGLLAGLVGGAAQVIGLQAAHPDLIPKLPRLTLGSGGASVQGGE
jgi:hypothetical protein